MIVGIRDVFKMIGIMIISACAVFVCTLFLNYNIDLKSIEKLINTEEMRAFYNAQVMTGEVACALTGGCLFLTSFVMLVFYIKHYIDTHKKELGILKAMGYSNLGIGIGFWVFGLSIFFGTALGYLGAYLIMPQFYDVQGKDKLLPEINMTFHPILFLCLILLPALFFAFLSILYSCLKLKMPVIHLLKEKDNKKVKTFKMKTEMSFLKEYRKNTVRQRKSLVFFIAFATFCYASMMQMSCSMNELLSRMMSIMTMLIGIVLAFVTLFIAITTVVNSNIHMISVMRAFGYSSNECSYAVLSGYRPIAYIGFVIGTIYQYGLLKMMVNVVYKDIENVPEYNFDVHAFIATLISFLIFYELLMYFYTRKISKVSIKEIMLRDE